MKYEENFINLELFPTGTKDYSKKIRRTGSNRQNLTLISTLSYRSLDSALGGGVHQLGLHPHAQTSAATAPFTAKTNCTLKMVLLTQQVQKAHFGSLIFTDFLWVPVTFCAL
jgi:hypothetical protein